MNSKLKKICLVYERKNNQYEECIDSILSIKADLNETITVIAVILPHAQDSNGQVLPFHVERSKASQAFHSFWLRIRGFCLVVMKLPPVNRRCQVWCAVCFQFSFS